KEIVNDETKQRRDRYDLLKLTWERFQSSLRSRRKELNSLAELTGSDDKRTVANIRQHELERLGRAETELTKIQSELRTLKVEYEVKKEEAELATSSVTPEMIEDAISKDRSIEMLEENISRSQRRIDSTARLTRNLNDPALQKYRGDMEAAK